MFALAGGIVYLDSFRGRQIDSRRVELRTEAQLMADALGSGPDDPPALVATLGRQTGDRLLVFTSDGRLEYDSWRMGRPTFALRDPAADLRRVKVARFIDDTINAITGVRPVPVLHDLQAGTLARWPEARAALGSARVVDALRRAPDGTPILTAAARVPGRGVLLLAADARDITYAVRDERLDSFLIFLGVLAFSLALSSYLARTIAAPLRRLASAAGLVRAGRERAVVVPRLPRRQDEIGQLARAVSDMATALRTRIDATEAFAADLAHELKNPLASLRSALETFALVHDPAQQRTLAELMTHDVVRLDRLVSDIAEASRLEAEISRARFQRLDLGELAREASGMRERDIRVEADGTGSALGDAGRLRQVVRNLVDNAVSFSPDGGRVRVSVGRSGRTVRLSVDDDGPGVPAHERERIFERFYTRRPDGEAFGRHSGLGLAIARAIADAHGGSLAAEGRVEGGARFTLVLPAA